MKKIIALIPAILLVVSCGGYKPNGTLRERYTKLVSLSNADITDMVIRDTPTDRLLLKITWANDSGKGDLFFTIEDSLRLMASSDSNQFNDGHYLYMKIMSGIMSNKVVPQ
ncbi:MAG: hypothetical protein HZC28_11025 [Spirochaetes bacterium]|nr:hypothetical protein [Spirochaetota bacterium]